MTTIEDAMIPTDELQRLLEQVHEDNSRPGIPDEFTERRRYNELTTLLVRHAPALLLAAKEVEGLRILNDGHQRLATKYRLQAEQLERDLAAARKNEERWNHVVEHMARMHSPKMDGQHSWSMIGYHKLRGSTFTEAIDTAISTAEGNAQS